MEDLRQKSIEELSHLMPEFDPVDINRHKAVLTEFTRRQLIAQIEATNAQKLAADATVEAAGYAGRNAKYMFWAVIIAAASAIISLVSTIYALWPKH